MGINAEGPAVSRLIYRLADAGQIEDFLLALRSDAAGYLETTLERLQITWPEFVQLAQTVGKVCGIYRDRLLVGYYWIETREKILHLHGFYVVGAYRGQGLGTEVLDRLARQHKGSMQAIELGVHESNQRAIALYQRVGYTVVEYREDIGFYMMRKSLLDPEAKAAG